MEVSIIYFLTSFFCSMGAKQEIVDKRVIIPPGKYDIPSKLIESNGKSFGLKPKLA